LYVKDCVDGICKLMDSDCKEIVNIGSDVHITINEYIELLRKVSGKQFVVRYIDGATGVKNRFCDLTKVKKLLDWKPIMTNDDIAKITYEWTLKQIEN